MSRHRLLLRHIGHKTAKYNNEDIRRRQQTCKIKLHKRRRTQKHNETVNHNKNITSKKQTNTTNVSARRISGTRGRSYKYGQHPNSLFRGNISVAHIACLYSRDREWCRYKYVQHPNSLLRARFPSLIACFYSRDREWRRRDLCSQMFTALSRKKIYANLHWNRFIRFRSTAFTTW